MLTMKSISRYRQIIVSSLNSESSQACQSLGQGSTLQEGQTIIKKTPHKPWQKTDRTITPLMRCCVQHPGPLCMAACLQCVRTLLCKQELLSCFPFPFLFSSGLLPRSTACLSGGFLWNTNKIVLWLPLETVLKFFFLMRWRTPWRNHSISDIKKGEFAFVKNQLVILEFKRPSEKDPGLAWAIKLEANLGSTKPEHISIRTTPDTSASTSILHRVYLGWERIRETRLKLGINYFKPLQSKPIRTRKGKEVKDTELKQMDKRKRKLFYEIC